MRRVDAEKMIGKRVQAWTPSNGVYVGNLESVVGKPWRARVRVTGVLSAPTLFEFGQSLGKKGFLRKGFRIGQMIEVGGCNCHATDEIGGTYLAALRAEKVKFESFKKNFEKRGDAVPSWILKSLPCIDAAIEHERNRLMKSHVISP